jgi:hypothetical protein
MSRGNVGKGVALAVVLTILGVPATLLVLPIVGETRATVGFGLVQLLWLVPTILHYPKCDEKETVKGLMIVGGLVFLLNAYCVGQVVNGSFRP